ncbi:cytochrome b561 domain-containing protein At4g18260-like [Telopea speciosissima]|uniref:cytochrome b561 domain-containing protein At4g18260-like n=1 Tax=Telopea speciosissima TaxID=54955 RepID=UPI001CC3C3E8|nr:cytochrome b561 domain-containing protein At4g18260-like [Telopea speciosissima]XP_043700954.1 cytochrome b561 domain-containing protein At4g18260-like [Telopea speciosissima]
MKIFQKLVFLTIASSIVVLALLPSVSSSSEEKKPMSNHKRKTQNMQKLSPELSFEITVHGFLLWVSMGFLMPVGILIIRMSNKVKCGRRLKVIFYFHVILQILSVLLATAGAVMSIRNFENSFSNNHQRLGLALYGVIWMQVIVGFFRPQRGTKGRSVWYFAHWALGTGISLMGIINIYTGLRAYEKKTLNSTRLWTLLFTAEIFFIAFLYLLQDKWEYMQKQRVILGNETAMPTDPVISPTTNQKEMIVP